MDKPKCCVKNEIKKVQLKVKVKIWNYIFNPTFGFVHIYPNLSSNNPALFRVYNNNKKHFYSLVVKVVSDQHLQVTTRCHSGVGGRIDSKPRHNRLVW